MVEKESKPRNRRLQREARRLQKELGVKYTQALRITEKNHEDSQKIQPL